MNRHLPRELRPHPEYLPASSDVRVLSGVDDYESEPTLREYWRVIFKYRYLIGVCVAACTIAALIYSFAVTPRFTASTKVRISVYQPVLSDTSVEDSLQERSKEITYLETQLQEMKSYSLADKILGDPKVRDSYTQKASAGFLGRLFGIDPLAQEVRDGDSYKAPVKLIRRYLEDISIAPVRRTSHVIISATHESPSLAAYIANRHAMDYIEWVRQVRVDQQASGLRFLDSQAQQYREKVAALERDMAEYAEANSIIAVNKDENITVQRMSQLNRLLTDVTAKKIEAEKLWQEAEDSLKNESAGFDDQSTQLMRSELAKLEAEYGQLSAKFMPGYPRMKQLAAQIARLQQGIQGQRRQVVRGLKAKALAAAEEEASLKEEMAQQTSKTFELSKKQVYYNNLNRELTTSRELLEVVLKQMKEMSLAAESNASNVSIVDLAAPPVIPSYPRKKLMVLLGFIGGVVLGISLAFLLRYLDSSVRTPEELVETIRVPSLGVVPSFQRESSLMLNGPEGSRDGQGESGDDAPSPPVAAQSQVPVMYINNPKSLASEAYRTIRTGILLSQAGEPPRTLLVTSAQSSEGKTTSSVNLAASLASAGGRVVLVDADLRRPSVYKYFNLEPNLPGLVDVVTGQRPAASVVLKDVVKRVSVIPSGRTPPNPAELLGSLEMAHLIDWLSAEYDYVVIDSPPILPVTDSVVLSRYVDGVVLVVKGAMTPRKVLRDARRRLDGVGARVLGAILNDVDITSGDYYYYNRYYYSYYHKDDEAPRANQEAHSA